MIWPLIRYILTAALRDRLFWAVCGILVITLSLSTFFGASVVTEQDQFVRVFASFGVRLFGTAALIMFVVTFIRRSFENRDVEYLLSRPTGRIKFVLSHAAAFTIIALSTSLLLGGAMVAMQSHAVHTGTWLWWASVTAEYIIMVNVAMFFALVMTSQTVCLMIVFAFYLLSRLIGEILGIVKNGGNEGLSALLAKVMEIISIFIPRLDLMGQTKWLLKYGVPTEISLPFVLAQCGVFLCVVIGASVIDMHRRQF